ncbi:unnamed protein product, partial [Symbiodinium sp. CCMP2456]
TSAPRACKPALCGIAPVLLSSRRGPTTRSFTTAAGRWLGILILGFSLLAAGQPEQGHTDFASLVGPLGRVFLVGAWGLQSLSWKQVEWRVGARAFCPAPASTGACLREIQTDEADMATPAEMAQAASAAQGAAAQQEAVVQHIAATTAEQVAANATQQRRSEQLARLVQRPDIYKPETRDQETDQWVDWRFAFVSYLGVIDSKFVEELEWVEAQSSEEKLMEKMDSDTQMRSRELYAILLSFVRNRPAKMVRAVTRSNGYEAWRQLLVEMMPSSRQRQLALASQLTATRLDPKRPINEQVGRYEELIREYERVSGSKYSEDLRISTLVAAAPPALQAQLHMALGPTTSYQEVRDKILLYERSTARWHATSSLAMPSLQDSNGPAPMEVDRVEKGKNGKGKGKKGKVYDMADDEEELDITYSVRAVTFLKYKCKGPAAENEAQDGKQCEIILDSGADASMVPRYLLREKCVVGPVRSPLLAVGKLLRRGWQLRHGSDDGQKQLHLEEPFGRKTAVGYRNHSLVVKGHIRALTEIPRSLPPRVPKIDLPAEILEKVGQEGMHELPNGWKMHFSEAATLFLDGRDWYDADYWCCRTTFLQSEGGRWLQVENSADYSYEANPFGRVSHVPVARITLFNMTPFDVSCFPDGLDPKESERFNYEPSPDLLPDPNNGEGEAAQGAAGPEPAKASAAKDPEDDETMGAPPAGLTQEELEAYVGTWAAKAVQDDMVREPTSLIAVDLQTRMVLSVPGPDKGPGMLRQAAEELTRFTVSLHGEETITMQSDGEPAVKALVRSTAAARQRLGRRTHQRTTPVGVHEANGAAERAIQTVRRLGNTFVEAFEVKRGKLSVGSHLRVWVQGHAAFIYNRFHLLPGLNKTPFELAYGGKVFDQKLCEFGEVVYGRVIRKYKGEAQWLKGVWCGINPHNGAHRLMSTFGHLECNAVRRGTAEIQMTAAEIESAMFGLPWEHGVVEKRRQARRRAQPQAVGVPVLSDPSSLLAPPTPATPRAASTGIPATPALSLGAPATPAGQGAQASAGYQEGPGDEAASDPTSSSSSEDELLAAADASPTGMKRKAEDSTAPATAARPKSEPTKGEKRKPDDSPRASGGDDGPTIRAIETVDAEWHDAVDYDSVMVSEVDRDFEDPEPDDLPPSLPQETVDELDEAAEIEEIERLEKMGVLLPDEGEEAEHLSTTFAKVWKKGEQGWFRRARLVARQYKWATQMDDDETFAPASVAPLGRLIPMMAMSRGTPVYVLDVKDAYLTVDQPPEEPVTITSPASWYKRHGEHKRWKLGKVLPGQRRGAQEWFMKFNRDLVANKLESMVEVPTLYRSLEDRFGAQLHVDDMLSTGDDSVVAPLHNDLESKYTVKIAGPYGEPGDEFEFLKRRYLVEADRSITVRPVLEHLAGYLWGTQGYGINLSMRKGESILRCEGEPSSQEGRSSPGHLVEAVSDSNFANDRTTRKSLSAGQIYVDRALAFSFVRAQKVVTTSSGEAELVALTQTVGEAILVRKAVAFLEGQRPEEVNLVARTDSSVARAIASRSGVGRVKHLATSCLWLQGWVARKELRVAAIPTEINPADVGTKVLSAKRLLLLLFILGMVTDNGEQVGQQEYSERRER